ncbi:hypothetical protein L3Q82_026127 [Scortum barcoo]|uniref:Uncharacterized protein n=1 Tax=Scortum barcoo TaxID=214431 RepID=A0ACB8WMW6_9TELE|nr:hypothetical protein L3Q82_026127 [Scortum barcoo]
MSLDNGKAPGIDGIPVEFYKAFWPVVGDYKVLSKALALRLREVMAEVVHVDQTYCVPGRLISDNIHLIRHVLDVSGSLGIGTGLISIDQEKAFDRVEHQYHVEDACCVWVQPRFHSLLGSRLAVVDPPLICSHGSRLFLVNFFWDRLHWLPQAVLFLPKEEGGQGLVHLASRCAAFRLQFIQRLLYGPQDLVWRPLAQLTLRSVGGLGLQQSVFLMDFKTVNLFSLPVFYRGLFSVWKLLRRQRVRHESSVLAAAGTNGSWRPHECPLLGRGSSREGPEDCRDFYSWGLDGVHWAGPTGDSEVGSWSGVEIAEERRSTAGSLESLSGGTGASNQQGEVNLKEAKGKVLSVCSDGEVSEQTEAAAQVPTTLESSPVPGACWEIVAICVDQVNRVIETGVTVNDMFVPVLPLTQPATKVILSNVPPFITDEFLSRELSRHGKWSPRSERSCLDVSLSC